jgi:hypothetical protein
VPFIPYASVNQGSDFAFGLDVYMEQVLADSPVAYWPMHDTSGLPVDVSGNGNDMTAVSGSPVYSQPGPLGDTAIEYPSAAFHERSIVSAATSNLTVEMWVYRIGNASGDIFRHGTTSGGFELEYTAAGGSWRPNLPGVGTLGGIPLIAPNVWTYIALTRDTTTWIGYLNGISEGSVGTANPGTPVGNDRVVGAGATGHRFAHVAFYNSALTPQRIMGHYLFGVGFS